VSLWDTATRRRARAFAGHAAAAEGAASLAFSPDGALCFSAARGERSVAVWAARGGGGGEAKARRAALSRLPLPDGAPLQLAAAPARGAARAAGDCLLVAVSSAGEAHAWLLGADGRAAGAQQRLRAHAPSAVLAAAAQAEEASAGAPRARRRAAHRSLFGGRPLPGLLPVTRC